MILVLHKPAGQPEVVLGMAQTENIARTMIHNHIIDRIMKPWEDQLAPDDFTLDGAIQAHLIADVMGRVAAAAEQEIDRYAMERI